MNAELWQRLKPLFHAALEESPQDRAAFVDSACGDDLELKRHLAELLDGEEQKTGTRDARFADLNAAFHMPLPVTKLGRYFIIEPLGSGGMGVVYRARDEKLERIVAIKILAPGLLRGEDARRRFNKEALALAKLSSSHIAAVYDVGEQDGIDYIVMECVPGESLSAKLSSGPLTVKDATSITLQIAEALEEAHEQGVIHRDLKPGNVMVTPKGQVKVLDFGLAKLLEVQGADRTLIFGDARHHRHATLYVSRTGTWGEAGHANGPVESRRCVLRVAYGAQAVQR